MSNKIWYHYDNIISSPITRDILHINDLCELIFIQICKFKSIYNKIFLCGGGSSNKISLKKLTALCERITKNKCQKKVIKNRSAYDVPFFVASNQVIKR